VAYEALDFHALYVTVPDAMAVYGVCIVKGLERNSPIVIAVLIAMANVSCLHGTRYLANLARLRNLPLGHQTKPDQNKLQQVDESLALALLDHAI
jgi:hypothetical protein